MGSMKHVLLTITYDGSGFFGWQRQKKQRSVQGEVEKALSIACGHKIEISGSSRTDRGVHALGQRATFSGTFGIPLERLKVVLNNLLPGDVRILSVEEVSDSLHARFSSVGKTYHYMILNSEAEQPFLRNYYEIIAKQLDIDRMREGAAYLIGEHDFISFMGSVKEELSNTVRTIYELNILEEELTLPPAMSIGTDLHRRVITLQVKGNAFLYNMVRIIAGTLIQVGLGKMEPIGVQQLLMSKSRQQKRIVASPCGLYLTEVNLDEDKRSILKR